MTIKLFDIVAQAEYAQEWEKYDEKCQKVMEAGPVSPTAAWPQMPKAPEPLIDSREQLPTRAMPTQPSMYPLAATDPRPQGIIDFDGNSQSTIKGFESKWTSCEDAAKTPFTIKK